MITRLSRLLRYPIAAAALVASLAAAVPPFTPPARAHLVPPSPEAGLAAPVFRLGTASRPFGWATAIADFNRDGLADTAVADRRSRVGAGYLYELRFSVSGLAARSVSFESPQPALTVSIRDVDHDNDLDVVVSEVVSRVVTNVWLNDGRGHFTEAPPAQAPNRLESVPGFETGDPAGAAATTTSGERAPLVLRFAGRVPGPVPSHIATTGSDGRLLCDRSYARPPRAPPAPASPAS